MGFNSFHLNHQVARTTIKAPTPIKIEVNTDIKLTSIIDIKTVLFYSIHYITSLIILSVIVYGYNKFGSVLRCYVASVVDAACNCLAERPTGRAEFYRRPVFTGDAKFRKPATRKENNLSRYAVFHIQCDRPTAGKNPSMRRAPWSPAPLKTALRAIIYTARCEISPPVPASPVRQKRVGPGRDGRRRFSRKE